MTTKFTQLVLGSKLLLTARVTCGECFRAGKRGTDAQILDPREFPIQSDARREAARKARIVRALVQHVAEVHGQAISFNGQTATWQEATRW